MLRCILLVLAERALQDILIRLVEVVIILVQDSLKDPRFRNSSISLDRPYWKSKIVASLLGSLLINIIFSLLVFVPARP